MSGAAPDRLISALAFLAGALAVALCCPASRAEARRLTPSDLFSQNNSESETSATDGEEEEFETDRDSFTPATSTVREGKIMVESAWSFIDNRDVPETHSLPELVLRYGASDWLELRFGTNYEVGGESGSVTGSEFGDDVDEALGGIHRATAISYGFKALLSGQEGWIPQSSFIVMGNTPVSGAETASSLVATYAWGWTFDNGWKWDSAIRYGASTAEHDHYNRWAPSTVLKVPVGEKTDVHAEYFGIFTDGRARESQQHYFSPGVAYMLTENLEIGLRVGWGLSDQSARFFSNIGIGWQF